jgi:hypothetical protein
MTALDFESNVVRRRPQRSIRSRNLGAIRVRKEPIGCSTRVFLLPSAELPDLLECLEALELWTFLEVRGIVEEHVKIDVDGAVE